VLKGNVFGVLARGGNIFRGGWCLVREQNWVGLLLFRRQGAKREGLSENSALPTQKFGAGP